MSTTATATSDTKRCWATLLTRTSYLAGALVMNESLIKHNSKYPLVVFATTGLPQEARDVLSYHGIKVRDIKYLEPDTKLELDGHDERFADTWTKLRCFEMVEYEVWIISFDFESNMNTEANILCWSIRLWQCRELLW